jgi:hypothetical protein
VFCEPLCGHECVFRLVKECGWDWEEGGAANVGTSKTQVVWLRWAVKILD